MKLQNKSEIKTIYTATSISDPSKILKKFFYHNYVRNKYGDKAEILLTDTGSLIYKIKVENVYQKLYKNLEFFYLSNYTED